MTQNTELHQNLSLTDRKRLTLDGVSSIMDFSETFLTLDTCQGVINVEGEGMVIEELSRDGGTVIVTGTISGIFFKKASSGGLFSKVFK